MLVQYPYSGSTFDFANIFEDRQPGWNHRQQVNMIELHIQLKNLTALLISNVADLICQGKFLYYDYPWQPGLDLRHLLSVKQKLNSQGRSILMRIGNHLVSQFFPELDTFYG